MQTTPVTAQITAPETKYERLSAEPLRILFAPDYRAGLTYQEDLARALLGEQVTTHFLSHYRRGLPLFRGGRDFESLQGLHLHWPEAYLRKPSTWRKARYAFDLSLALRSRPLFLTAHNLYPHNRRHETWMRQVLQFTVRKSSAIFVHSSRAAELYIEELGARPLQCQLIPFGDHSQAVGAPIDRNEARNRLGLPDDARICLMFGTVSPYKGQEELIAAWKSVDMRATLYIVGPAVDATYAEKLQTLAGGGRDISLRIGDWLSPADLRLWLSASDAVVFNYRAILTSGAGCLARAFGLPILFPASLDAVDLGEPHPSVFRYHDLRGDFPLLLEQALSRGLKHGDAAAYRDQTRWEHVAESTARIYREVTL
jgi:beta-1,4-mannosyltransferase